MSFYLLSLKSIHVPPSVPKVANVIARSNGNDE